MAFTTVFIYFKLLGFAKVYFVRCLFGISIHFVILCTITHFMVVDFYHSNCLLIYPNFLFQTNFKLSKFLAHLILIFMHLNMDSSVFSISLYIADAGCSKLTRT